MIKLLLATSFLLAASQAYTLLYPNYYPVFVGVRQQPEISPVVLELGCESGCKGDGIFSFPKNCSKYCVCEGERVKQNNIYF